MWPLKAHYLLWFGSLSGILPFTSIFARNHLNISSDEVGILFFILPFVVFIIKPLVCSIADHYNCHSLSLLVAQTLMIIGYGLLLVIPFVVELIGARILFWIFCFLILVANTSMGAGVSLTDYLVMNEVIHEKQLNKNVNYGDYRIWGTIGFGIFGVLSGVINDSEMMPRHLPYLIPGLIMFVSIELVDIGCIFKFYHRKRHHSNNESQNQISIQTESIEIAPNEITSIMNDRKNGNNISDSNGGGCLGVVCHGFRSVWMIFQQVGHIFRHYPTLIQISFIVFCFGILTAFHWSFFFWYLEDLRGKDTLLMGLCILVESFIGEIPIFYVAHHIIQRFGAILSLCLALLAFSFRYLAYGYWLIQDQNNRRYWDILLVEVLQGLTFSLFYTVMTHVAQYYADKCEERKLGQENGRKVTVKPSATMQGLMSGCYEGIGLGTGSLLGGYITKQYGIRMIWRFGAFLSIGLIIFNLVLEIIKLIFKKKSTSFNNDQR